MAVRMCLACLLVGTSLLFAAEEDIAAAMDMTPKAIKSLLSRARENLRQILEPYLEQGRRPE